MNGLNGLWPARRSRALGDVDGVVADALEVVVDLQRRDQEPQVHGDRLLERQELDRLVLDHHLHAVDLLVGRDDVFAPSSRRPRSAPRSRAGSAARPRRRSESGCAADPRAAPKNVLSRLLPRSDVRRLAPERLGREHLEVLLVNLLLALAPAPPRNEICPVEDPLEEVRLVARGRRAPPRSRRGPPPRARPAASGRDTRRPSRAGGGCGRGRRRCAGWPRASRRRDAGTGSRRRQFSCAPSGPPPCGSARSKPAPRPPRTRTPSGRRA